MTVPTFKECRNTIWASLEANSGTANYFKRKYKLNASSHIHTVEDLTPGMGEMPAIMVKFRSTTPAWWTYQMQAMPLVFAITIWTPHWNDDTAMDAAELVYNAIWNTPHTVVTSRTFISAPHNATPIGTGFIPERFSVTSCDMAEVGGDGDETNGNRCMVTQIELVLKRLQTPYTAGA